MSRVLWLTLLSLAPGFAFAADYRELRSGVTFTLTQPTVVYDLDTARHFHRDARLPKWTALDESSPVRFLGVGLKRVHLPAGTRGVMMKDAYVILTDRNRSYADCVVVFSVGDRHFTLINSDSIIGNDLNVLMTLVQSFPALAVEPVGTAAVAELVPPK